MKKILFIIFISFLCVAAALGILVGGMYLFGGFEEKDVYANDISFSLSEVVSSEPFALKITTNTPEVNKKNLKLSVLAGGESVIDFPSQVEIGEIFTVIPKQENGSNHGGNVTLVATYDYDNSNQSVKAYCEIMIDVAAKELSFKKEPFSTTLNQKILIAAKNSKVSSVFGVNPEKALMPYVSYGTPKVGTIEDKKLFLQLVYKNVDDVVLEKNVARFLVDDTVQDSDYIEVKYSYKKINDDYEIVFDNNIAIETYKQEEVYVKAYLYSTYKDQANNTENGVVSFNKNDTVKAKLGFTIGNYEITNMSIVEDEREVYLNEDCYIYLNNPAVTGNDINLGAELTTGSPGIEASDFYLLNTYIKVDNEPYRLLANNIGETTDDWLPINYADITRLEKNEWRWKLNINSFLAYQSGEPLKVSIRYYHVNDSNGKVTEFIKSFNIKPKIYEAKQVTVSYPEGKEAFELKSGSVLSLKGNDFKIEASVDGTTPTYSKLAYYLSYSENYDLGTTIVTVPNTKNTYKVTFDFELKDTTNDRYEIAIDRSVSRWCEINEVKYTQKSTVERTYFVDYKNNANNFGENNFEPNKTISVEAIINLISQPTEEDLFVINSNYANVNIESCSITNFMAKFYELIDSKVNTYSEIPYLSVDGVRYYIDFDYYYDQTTATKYLKINDELITANSYKVQGIGTIRITAQLVYEEGDVLYWLNKSATAVVNVSEDLSNLTAFEYVSAGDTQTYDKAFVLEEIAENEADANGEKVYRNIFITSTELNSLKNYVEADNIEIYAEQIFSLDEEQNKTINDTYANIPINDKEYGIQSINKNAISFSDSWIAVTVNDIVVGYRRSYTINEVHDIKLQENIEQGKFRIVIRINVNGEYVYASFLVQENPADGKTIKNENYLSVNIKNIVLDTASITYDGTTYGDNNPFVIYADTRNTGEVFYRTNTSSEVNFNNLKYFFRYKDESLPNTTETLTATFEALNSDFTKSDIYMNNGGAYYSFEKSEDGVGGLVFKNFPRFEDGLIVKMSIKSQTMLDFNSQYEYNHTKGAFEQKQKDIVCDFYFKVYGLVIEISANEFEVYGASDTNFNILGSTTDDSVFTVVVKSLKPGATDGTTCKVVNYLDIFNISVYNTGIFAKDESKLAFNDSGSSLTFANDIMGNENGEEFVSMEFFVGDTLTTSSLILINVEGQKVASYDQKVKSPFEVEFVQEFTAPSTDNTFVTVLYKTESFEGLTESQLAEKRAEAIQKAIEKLNISLNYVSSTLDANYNIETPIVVSNLNLTFKAVPSVDEEDFAYTATMRLVLSLKEGGAPRQISKTIKVRSTILSSDIIVGKEADDGQGNTYYYIDAGVSYFIDKEETVEEEGIKILGSLKDNFANVSDIKLSFEDVDYQVDSDINVDASTHMIAPFYDANAKILTFSSKDLNYQKTIKITFTIEFTGGGKVIISKQVVVRPNLFMKLESDTYEEGDDINLTVSILFKRGENSAYQALDLSGFDYENTSLNYNKTSFSFDSKAFKDTSKYYDDGPEYESFLIKVLTGASQLTEEQRTVTFKYVVDNSYVLIYHFVLDIVAY